MTRTLAHGRGVRLPAALVVRLERVAAANGRSVAAEATLVLDEHAERWEAAQQLGADTRAAAYANLLTQRRRDLAEESAREAVAELRRERIESVRSLPNWIEIAEPEERGRLIFDPETGDLWQPCRGLVFETNRTRPVERLAQCAFYVRDGEVVALEPSRAMLSLAEAQS